MSKKTYSIVCTASVIIAGAQAIFWAFIIARVLNQLGYDTPTTTVTTLLALLFVFAANSGIAIIIGLFFALHHKVLLPSWK